MKVNLCDICEFALSHLLCILLFLVGLQLNNITTQIAIEEVILCQREDSHNIAPHEPSESLKLIFNANKLLKFSGKATSSLQLRRRHYRSAFLHISTRIWVQRGNQHCNPFGLNTLTSNQQGQTRVKFNMYTPPSIDKLAVRFGFYDTGEEPHVRTARGQMATLLAQHEFAHPTIVFFKEF
jgi:hypothetical protein